MKFSVSGFVMAIGAAVIAGLIIDRIRKTGEEAADQPQDQTEG